MAIVPQPHRAVDLITSGAKSLGDVGSQSYGYYMEQQRLDEPGDPALDKYFNRLLAKEDPVKVAAEARNDPSVQALLQKIASQGQPGPNPAATVPDVGMPRGQPSVLPPGTVSPSGGPAGPSGPGGLAAMGGGQPPAPTPRPAQDQQPLPYESRSTDMQHSVDFYDPGSGVRTTRPGPMETTMQTAQGQPAGQRVRTVREQQRLMGLMPTLAAAEGRREVAGIQADAKTQAADMRNQTMALVAIMKENGLQDRDISKTLTQIEGLDVKQQIAVLKALTDIEKARIGAGATLGAAKTRADAGSGPEDPAEKELRTSINALANITSKPEWQKDAASMAEFKRLTARISELQSSLGRPAGQTAPRRSAKPKPAAPSTPPQSGGTIRVRIKKTGQTGSIPAANFDPVKYEKI